MSAHLGKEITKLKRMILELCTSVEENVRIAVDAVEEIDPEKAITVINKDRQIDMSEIDIEEECLKILALYQPVAIDLRYVVTCLKLNNDLERIGDLAKKIAKKALKLKKLEITEIPFDFCIIEEKTKKMVRESIQSLINSDPKMAMQVCLDDDEVDDLEEKMKRFITDELKNNNVSIDVALLLIGVARNLERIADYATNIAEDVIYLVRGEIVRHKSEISI